MIPWADVMYGCDAHWWRHHKGTEFKGEKWATHEMPDHDNTQAHEQFGVHLIAGKDAQGFSFDPSVIHYGQNSGFQAVNLALHFGARHIILVGFDMRRVDDKAHFFGDHPAGLNSTPTYVDFINAFTNAKLPSGVRVINATPNSALKCFPMMSFDEAVNDRLLWHRTFDHAAAG